MQETYFTKANIKLQQKHMLQPDAFKHEQNQIAGVISIENRNQELKPKVQ